MTPQSIRLGPTEILITPAESEDGSFTASTRGGKHPDQSFDPADWTDPRTRLDAARAICEAFNITRNNQHLTKIANTIEQSMSG
jgi:hypothetical protein